MSGIGEARQLLQCPLPPYRPEHGHRSRPHLPGNRPPRQPRCSGRKAARDPDGGSLGRDELPSLLEKYRDLFIQAEVQTQEELEEKIMRRMTQLGFASEDNGVYRFLPPMHRFLDVCLSVQQDRDLAASLHSVLPLPAPVLIDEDSDEKLLQTDDPLDLSEFEGESEEDALARAIAEEQETDA